MSVHTAAMCAKHSALLPVFPTSDQPAGMGDSASQIEYCCSEFTTTE